MLYIYAYKYIHICMYMYIYIRIYIYIYVCICKELRMKCCIYMHTNIYIYVCIRKYVYVHLYLYLYLYIYIYMYMCVCIYMHIYTHIWVHSFTLPFAHFPAFKKSQTFTPRSTTSLSFRVVESSWPNHTHASQVCPPSCYVHKYLLMSVSVRVCGFVQVGSKGGETQWYGIWFDHAACCNVLRLVCK